MRWLWVLCPPVWLAAFLVGARAGLVPAIALASLVLTVLALAADGRAILQLFRPTVRGVLLGVAGAVAAVALPDLGFHLFGSLFAVPTRELYAHFPNRDLAHALVIVGVVIAEEIIWRGFVQSA